MALRRRIAAVTLAALATVLLLWGMLCPPNASEEAEAADDGYERERTAAPCPAVPACLAARTADLAYLDRKLKATAAELKRLVLLGKGLRPTVGAPLSDVNGTNRLSVGSLNLWGFKNNWEARHENIMAMLAVVPFDIIGLQEVHEAADGATTQAHDLAPHLAHVVYKRVLQHATDASLHEGLAIASRFPITDPVLHVLPTPPHSSDPNPRAALHAVVHSDRGDVHVFVTHLTYDAVSQCSMALGLMDFIASAAPPAAAVVLVGDFNT
jgi:hypothetical protein